MSVQILPSASYRADNDREGIGYGRHRFNEYIQRYTNDILSGIAYGVAGNSSLVCRGAFAMAFDSAGLDILLGVIERAAGVAHEDGSGYSDNRRAYQ